jgi:hypothetical protein
MQFSDKDVVLGRHCIGGFGSRLQIGTAERTTAETELRTWLGDRAKIGHRLYPQMRFAGGERRGHGVKRRGPASRSTLKSAPDALRTRQ